MSESYRTAAAAPPASSGLGTRLPRTRQLYGFAVALIGAPLLTVLILPTRDSLGLDTALLLYILVSVAASAVGGVWPALAASLESGMGRTLSLVPIGSMLVMGMRILSSTVSASEVALSVIGSVLMFAGIVMLGYPVYRRGLTQR